MVCFSPTSQGKLVALSEQNICMKQKPILHSVMIPLAQSLTVSPEKVGRMMTQLYIAELQRSSVVQVISKADAVGKLW